MAAAELRVEVAYGTPTRQLIRAVQVAPGTTVEEAIRASGILEEFPEIDLARNSIGVYGERVTLADSVCDGDRVEILRALLADPKEARRQRARSRGRAG
jgi:putative ubiquitin-RnfH superfamily antitoxin RatB of RatAB toxin-antitoxin module